MNKRFFIIVVLCILMLLQNSVFAISPPGPPPIHPDAGKPTFTGSSSNHTLLLSYGGTITAWGDNTYGQCAKEPIEATVDMKYYIPKFADVVQVTVGETFSLALDKDGNVWSWGDNRLGQLGRTLEVQIPGPPATGYSYVPEKVGVVSNIVQIAAGKNHALALDKDGNVWSWGDNTSLQLGRLDVVDNTWKAKKLNLPEKATYITARNNNSLVLLENNQICTFGDNTYGQLADGSAVSKNNLAIVKLVSNLTVHKISLGNQHAIALVEDENEQKAIYAWGDNSKHQLGITDVEKSNVPVKVYENNNIIDIIAGNDNNIVSRINEYDEIWWGSGCTYLKPTTNDWNYDYSEDVLIIPTERNVFRSFVAIGNNDTISYSMQGIEISNKNNYNLYPLATLSPREDIHYSTLNNETEYTLSLNFMEFRTENITVDDIKTHSFYLGKPKSVKYLNSRQCMLQFDQNSLITTWMSPDNPKGTLLAYISFDVLTVNTLVPTNEITVWYFGQKGMDASKYIKVENISPNSIVEGSENNSTFDILLNPEQEWPVDLPFYSINKNNGIDGNWHLGLTFSNLPSGVSVKSVTVDEQNKKVAHVVIEGNANEVYDSDRRIDVVYLYDKLQSEIIPDTILNDIDKQNVNAISGSINFSKKHYSGGGGGGGNRISIPSANMKSGEIVKNSLLALTTTYSNAKIYYTTDGSTPTKNSTLYTEPILIDKAMTVKSIVVTSNRTSSVASQTFTVRNAEIALKQNADKIRYIKGYSDGTFRPDEAISRYDVLSCLNNLFEIEKVQSIKNFTDVEDQYKALVDLFVGAEIIEGYADGTFKGDKGLTRAEFVKIIFGMLNMQEDNAASVSNYSDINGHWAENAIKSFTKLGYLKGYDDGTFKPDSMITRAEFTSLMNRIIGVRFSKQSSNFTDLSKEYWAYDDISSVYIKQQ